MKQAKYEDDNYDSHEQNVYKEPEVESGRSPQKGLPSEFEPLGPAHEIIPFLNCDNVRVACF